MFPSRLALALSVAGICGCVGLPIQDGSESESPKAVCQEKFSDLDQRLARAEAFDAGVHRLDDFPFLRSNRFLASFADEARSPVEVRTWLEHLRELDQDTRQLELQQLGLPQAERDQLLTELALCGRQLLTALAENPATLKRAREQAQVPDSYSTLARIFGLYPLTMPFLRQGIAGYQREIRRDYQIPWRELTAQGHWQRWHWPQARQPTAQARGGLQAAADDALGIPKLTTQNWQELLQAHAPEFLIESASPADVPGQVVWSSDGRVQVATDQPTLYLKTAWTRYQDQVLPQLIYMLWFSERPPERGLDPYAGHLDGLIWRVTLDEFGHPMVHDTIHACGCYHYFFPVQHLQAGSASWHEEPTMLPQGQVPWSDIAVVVGAGDHYVRRVIPATAVTDKSPRTLTAAPYDHLRALPHHDGTRQSIFGTHGIVPGSQRLERYWLWLSGVPDPGAMRQWGTHATAFVGTAHFDDPALLDKVFGERCGVCPKGQATP